MKGNKYTTEDKIRILREADSGKNILEVCREHNISEVSFHRWKRQYISIGNSAFSGCQSLTSVTMGNGVTNIGADAFASCNGLICVAIPISVTVIGDNAFQGCNNLNSALFAGNAPSMGKSVFSYTASGFTVYYYNGATGFTPPRWYNEPTVDIMGVIAPPTVSSETATGTAYNATTLGGTIDPNGFPAFCYFQYGMTDAYGITTPL